MKNKRRLSILFNKLYMLCLIIVLVGCIPATAPPSKSIKTPTEAPLSSFSMRSPIINGEEQTDWLFTPSDRINQLQRDSLVMQLYEFPANVKIEARNFGVNELRNEQDVFTDHIYLTSPPQNSGPSGLPNSGGGGSGGRRRTTRGM